MSKPSQHTGRQAISQQQAGGASGLRIVQSGAAEAPKRGSLHPQTQAAIADAVKKAKAATKRR